VPLAPHEPLIHVYAVASVSGREKISWLYGTYFEAMYLARCFFLEVAKVQSTNHILVLIDMNLAHKVFLIDILFE
jgi:hypothetical protein